MGLPFPYAPIRNPNSLGIEKLIMVGYLKIPWKSMKYVGVSAIGHLKKGTRWSTTGFCGTLCVKNGLVWMDGCMHGRMDTWMHGYMDAWMHTFMDGCMHACMYAWYTPSIVDGKIAYEIWCLSNIYTYIMHHSRSLCVLYVVYVYLPACRRVLWIVVVMSTRMNKPGFIN